METTVAACPRNLLGDYPIVRGKIHAPKIFRSLQFDSSFVRTIFSGFYGGPDDPAFLLPPQVRNTDSDLGTIRKPVLQENTGAMPAQKLRGGPLSYLSPAVVDAGKFHRDGQRYSRATPGGAPHSCFLL